MSLARLAFLYAVFGVIATALNLAAQATVHAAAPPVAAALAPAFPAEEPTSALGAALRAMARGPEESWLLYWGALFVGTGVGLIVKYVLDKRWIFDDRSAGAAAHGRRFSLYTLMGLATTVVFWGSQTAFFLTWGSGTAIYIGGALGLSIGYVIKYHLDKRFVFMPSGAGTAPA